MPKKDVKIKIVAAALDLAVEQGWVSVSLQDIAQKADMPLAALHEHVEDKTDILIALGRLIDRQVLEAVEGPELGVSPRERLFDILMERYEALNGYREGVCAVLESFKCDPKEAVISLPHLGRSMSWMLEAAGLETGGLRGAVKVAGLTGVYLKVLYTWKQDETDDLSKTMAALDKALGRVEYVAELTGL